LRFYGRFKVRTDSEGPGGRELRCFSVAPLSACWRASYNLGVCRTKTATRTNPAILNWRSFDPVQFRGRGLGDHWWRGTSFGGIAVVRPGTLKGYFLVGGRPWSGWLGLCWGRAGNKPPSGQRNRSSPQAFCSITLCPPLARDPPRPRHQTGRIYLHANPRLVLNWVEIFFSSPARSCVASALPARTNSATGSNAILKPATSARWYRNGPTSDWEPLAA
jgi:hypothetical protein